MTVNFFNSDTTTSIHPYFSVKYSKPGTKKINIDQTYENFVPFMTQQKEDSLNNQPTSGIVGFRNAMVDSILHGENEIIHQSNGTLLSVYI